MNPPKNKLLRWFLYRARGDSPFMKTVVHLTLVLAAIVMIYPVLRVVTVSLRSGDRLLNTDLDLIPTDRIRVPQGFTEAELQLVRERPLQDIIVEGSVVERGVLARVETENRRHRARGTETRTITRQFSNETLTLETYVGMTDRALEGILYRDPRRIQEIMDAKIAARHEFLEAEIRFGEADIRILRLPTAYTRELLAQKIQLQIANNIYGGRMPAHWRDFLAPEFQALREADRVLVAEKSASPDEMVRATIDPMMVQAISQMDQVKSLMRTAVVTVQGETVYEGFIPFNVDIRGMEAQILYVVEGAVEISYWTATFGNYLDVFTQTDFFLWIWNSLLITISTAFLGVALSSTGAYAFSRFEFPGRKAGLIFLLTTQMIPAGMLMLPIYILSKHLGLLGQWSGLVVAYSVGSIPFSIWILKGYYDTIPRELEEAATIDGATKMQTFFKIMLPLAAPALAIVFLFNFMNAWNDFLLARVMLHGDDDKFTWPLGLARMQGHFDTQWGLFSAAALMVSVPVVILFLSSSKYLVGGLTLGSVKG